MPKVSIVLSIYNEEKNIENILQSCKSQSYKNIEIIVVDSIRSSDAGKFIAKKYTSKVYKYGRERSDQRNFGVSKSSGEYLLVVDADMILDPDLIKTCIYEVVKNKKNKSLIIPEKSYGENYWAKCKALERNCYVNEPSIEAARFFVKKSFLQVGGYNVNMISGEDWDLHRRLKTQGSVGRVEKFIYHNEGRMSLVRDIQKKYYYSKNSDSYISSNVGGINDILTYIFRPVYLRKWKILIKDPIHLPGFILMKFLEIFVGGVSIITKKVFWEKIIS